MRIAVYLRVSTDSQTTDNQIPDVETCLKQYPEAEIIYFRENETAWKAGHQHELARLKDEIRNGIRKYDLVIVWALDRLCREGGLAIIHQWEFFARHGVKLISIKEDWSNIPVEFVPVMLALFGYLAQMESKRRSERVKAGIARKASTENWNPGRQQGAKDKSGKRRRRAGYLRRYARDANKLPPISETDN